MSTNNKDIVERINIPENVSVEINNSVLLVRGPKGSLDRKFTHPLISIKNENK
jgi:ribosomal protein L6P/L9E